MRIRYSVIRSIAGRKHLVNKKAKLENRLVQWSYENGSAGSRVNRLQKSVRELERILKDKKLQGKKQE